MTIPMACGRCRRICAVKPGEDRQKYLDIGESDRMTLKFRKPAGAK